MSKSVYDVDIIDVAGQDLAAKVEDIVAGNNWQAKYEAARRVYRSERRLRQRAFALMRELSRDTECDHEPSDLLAVAHERTRIPAG